MPTSSQALVIRALDVYAKGLQEAPNHEKVKHREDLVNRGLKLEVDNIDFVKTLLEQDRAGNDWSKYRHTICRALTYYQDNIEASIDDLRSLLAEASPPFHVASMELEAIKKAREDSCSKDQLGVSFDATAKGVEIQKSVF